MEKILELVRKNEQLSNYISEIVKDKFWGLIYFSHDDKAVRVEEPLRNVVVFSKAGVEKDSIGNTRDYVYEFKAHEEHQPYDNRGYDADYGWTCQISRRNIPNGQLLKDISEFFSYGTDKKHDYTNDELIADDNGETYQEAIQNLSIKYGLPGFQKAKWKQIYANPDSLKRIMDPCIPREYKQARKANALYYSKAFSALIRDPENSGLIPLLTSIEKKICKELFAKYNSIMTSKSLDKNSQEEKDSLLDEPYNREAMRKLLDPRKIKKFNREDAEKAMAFYDEFIRQHPNCGDDIKALFSDLQKTNRIMSLTQRMFKAANSLSNFEMADSVEFLTDSLKWVEESERTDTHIVFKEPTNSVMYAYRNVGYFPRVLPKQIKSPDGNFYKVFLQQKKDIQDGVSIPGIKRVKIVDIIKNTELTEKDLIMAKGAEEKETKKSPIIICGVHRETKKVDAAKDGETSNPRRELLIYTGKSKVYADYYRVVRDIYKTIVGDACKKILEDETRDRRNLSTIQEGQLGIVARMASNASYESAITQGKTLADKMTRCILLKNELIINEKRRKAGDAK